MSQNPRLVDYSDSDSSRTTLDESVDGSADGCMLDEPGGNSATYVTLDEPGGGLAVDTVDCVRDEPGGGSAMGTVNCVLDEPSDGSAVDCVLDESGDSSAVDCALNESGGDSVLGETPIAYFEQSPASEPNSEPSRLYELSAANKILTPRVPGFPVFQASGRSRDDYLKSLQERIENVSGEEASGQESDTDDSLANPEVRNFLLPVCPCNETEYLKALKEDEDVEESESEVHTQVWKSSGYSSTDDEPYVPHLGTSCRVFPQTPPTEDDRKLSPESENEYVSDEVEESEQEEEQIKRPKKKQRKSQCCIPLDTPLQVLAMPDWKPNWNVKKLNSMRLVENLHKLQVLSFFEQGVRGPTILFNDIPRMWNWKTQRIPNLCTSV